MENIEVRGRDLIAGIPKTLTIDSEEIRLAIMEQTDAIVEAVNAVLEHTPAELAADITDKGIVLTGGGALLKNMDKLLTEKTNLPINISEDPLTTVALGAGKVIDSIEILKQVMII
jgi:rod shape-determining protein MreB